MESSPVKEFQRGDFRFNPNFADDAENTVLPEICLRVDQLLRPIRRELGNLALSNATDFCLAGSMPSAHFNKRLVQSIGSGLLFIIQFSQSLPFSEGLPHENWEWQIDA